VQYFKKFDCLLFHTKLIDTHHSSCGGIVHGHKLCLLSLTWELYARHIQKQQPFFNLESFYLTSSGRPWKRSPGWGFF